MKPLFRFFCWSILVGSFFAWAYLGYVGASPQEAVLVEDCCQDRRSKVILPGKFSFIPSRIIPGKIILRRIALNSRTLELSVQKGLKKSEVLDLDPSFYISIKIHLTYSLNADKLDSIIQKLEKRNPNRLNHYLKVKTSYLVDKKISEFYQSDSDLPELQGKIEFYFQNTALSQFQKEFQKEGIHINSLTPLRIFVPDPEYYRSMLASSKRILESKLKRIQAVNEARARKDASEITDLAYFSRLNKIGKLLEIYPSLREYITADRLSNNVEVMIMPYSKWFPPSSLRSPKYSNRDQDQFSSQEKGSLIPQSGLPSNPQSDSPNLKDGRPNQGFQDLTPP